MNKRIPSPQQQFSSWCTLHHIYTGYLYNIIYTRCTRVYNIVYAEGTCIHEIYASVNHSVQTNKRVRYHNMSSVFVAFGDAQPFCPEDDLGGVFVCRIITSRVHIILCIYV